MFSLHLQHLKVIGSILNSSMYQNVLHSSEAIHLAAKARLKLGRTSAVPRTPADPQQLEKINHCFFCLWLRQTLNCNPNKILWWFAVYRSSRRTKVRAEPKEPLAQRSSVKGYSRNILSKCTKHLCKKTKKKCSCSVFILWK